MKKNSFLIFVLIIGLLGQAQAKKKSLAKSYEVISYDPIPMFFVDSVRNFEGKKVPTNTLTPDDFLYYSASLAPAYRLRPITKTFETVKESLFTNNCFHFSGGMVPGCVNYQAIIGKDTILINSHEQFRSLYAPVNTVQEAIAFAYIFTDAKPIYDLDFLKNKKKNFYTTYEDRLVEPRSKGWAIYWPTVSSSYVRKVEDGYEMLLYYYEVFGCSHPYEQRVVKVYVDGRVEVLSHEKIFENMEEDGLCVD